MRRDHLLLVGRAALDVVEGGAGRQQLYPTSCLFGVVRVQTHGAVWGYPQLGGSLVHVLCVGVAVSLFHGMANVARCVSVLDSKQIGQHSSVHLFNTFTLTV